MKLLFNRSMRNTIMRAFLYVLALGLAGNIIYANEQYPDLPVLGFGVRDGGNSYTTGGDIRNPSDQSVGWWPDNRIWSVPSKTTEWKEVLVPVFIMNRWYNFFPDSLPGVVFQEISSFAFRVYYDDRVLQFVDVQKHHPYTEEEARNLRSTRYFRSGLSNYYTPLATNFNVAASNNKATDYYKYFDRRNTSYSDNGIGSIVSISGTASSFHNLPTTPFDQFRVLLYLKFRVLPTGQSNEVRTGQLYFDPTYICYNGVNIAKQRGVDLLETYPLPGDQAGRDNFLDRGFRTPKKFADFTKVNDNMQYFEQIEWSSADKEAQVDARSIGLQKYHNYNDASKYNNEPYLPGSITLRVMPSYNAFNFAVISGGVGTGSIVRDATNPSLWRLTAPITADSLVRQRTSYNNRSERGIIVTAAMSYPATLEDIIVETDQDWLKVRSQAVNLPNDTTFEDKFGTATAVRRAYCQRINNLIEENAANYNQFTVPDQGFKPFRWRLFVECSQAGLAPGEYIGHVTLKSPFDLHEATRIQVKFIVLDNALERATTFPNEEVPSGIKLKITPFNGVRTDLARTLIMGTAPLGTSLVDSLYGEFAREHTLGLNRNGDSVMFDARFFLDTTVFSPEVLATMPTAQKRDLTQFGFGDYTHLDGITNTSMYSDHKTPRSDSRDIRSSNSGITTHTFHVKYKYRFDGTENYYPIVLEWDANHFNSTPANTIHLRYMENGRQHIVDMRNEGTPIGNGRYSLTFTDRDVQEFFIEYSVGQNVESNLVDNFGDPMIMPNAWNFVSLPLDPINKFHKVIFPLSMNIPYQFFNNAWQTPDAGMLSPGVGYFVKYNNIVDTEFRGAYFDHISKDNYPIKLSTANNIQGGWNAIGALSRRTTNSGIDFESTENGEVADLEYTLNHGVWAYRPNRGYAEVNSLYPGKAYFIKVNKNSYLRLSPAGPSGKSIELLPTLKNKVAGFDKITVADANQNIADLYAANNLDINNYQLPPLPPIEMFDIRFSKNNYASNYETSLVNMQGISYPVSINFNNPRANYSIVDPVSGEVYGNIKAGETNNVIINYSKSNSFKLVAEATNETFFVNVNQNPVTTNTAEVSFGIDNDANVSLSIYNAVGNEVANINGMFGKGVHNTTFDVTNLSAGAYTVRLLANGEARIFMMTIVK